ncbi:tribbles homolog 2 [Cimex lectularius]|uniref:Uncharacterized protein n=1 Tax=Cimex lectularius TaxID=79782 RepID=A0A7E4S9M3_CIMLE|nr:tribbles homolog 2 [Cimex lectularius]
MQVERGIDVPVDEVPLKKVRGDVCPEENSPQAPQVVPPASHHPRQEKTQAPVASLLANKYILINPIEGCPLHKCLDVVNDQEYVCRVISRGCTPLMSAHFRLDGHPRINPLHEVVLGNENMYLVFPSSYGDLHTHVRLKKRLRESEAKRLFRQVAETVKECHEQGVVLRDLKLRKFVFSNPQRTELKLENLEDAVVLEDGEDDILQDKRGCPAYVSPEILKSHARYSGRAADMWSLGVILYTMLVGRYPFNDAEHANLFMKISRGHFLVPECLSSKSKCLIRSLLRKEPSERLTASDVLIHPWLTTEERCYHSSSQDQIVPDV